MKQFPVDFLVSEQTWPLFDTENFHEVNSHQHFTSTCCTEQISTKNVKNVTQQKLFDVEDGSFNPLIYLLNCPICLKTVAVWIGNWWPIDSILRSNDVSKDKFCQVTTPGERLVLWCLNSIVFGQYENENKNCLQFLDVLPQEFCKIYWQNGVACAFYTLKPKGMKYNLNQLDVYCMSVVDLVFVSKKSRRSGICTKAIEDVVRLNPDQDIGFSSPVSDAMYTVLSKFLKENPKMKSKMWETRWIGCEGYRKSIWFNLSKKKIS